MSAFRYLFGMLPCGAVRNGHFGFYGSDLFAESLFAFEDTGHNSYREHITPVAMGLPMAVGCGNPNGLRDLATNWGTVFQIWEAAAPDSFPSRLVFADSSSEGCGTDDVQFRDLDRDGLNEIVAGRYGVEVWENQGNNHYVKAPLPRPWPAGSPAIADFDRDSLMEVGCGDGDGWLHFWECLGHDWYVVTCSMPPLPGLAEDGTYGCAAVLNMEGDGFPGLAAVDQLNGEHYGQCLIRIVKEPVHDSFVCVCTLMLRCNQTDGHVVAGNFEGDGRDGFAVCTGDDIHLFKYTAAGRYEQVWHLGWPAQVVQAFDLNQDGRDELVISADSTYIYEDTEGLGVAEFTKLPQLRTFMVQPTVARLGVPVVFSGVPPGSDIEVLSLDGRLVSRTQAVRQSTWSWNLHDQSGRLVPAGTYFAVIRSKGKATSLKLCVVK